jgi:hypothetical protein
MLGHTNIKTTQIYGKIIEEKVNDEMDKIREQLKAVKYLDKYLLLIAGASDLIHKTIYLIL